MVAPVALTAAAGDKRFVQRHKSHTNHLFKIHRKTEDAVACSIEMETPKDECRSEFHSIEVVARPVARPHRQIGKNERLAYCDDCQEWTPMKWLPIGKRGKTAETWFECEYCGGRKLTLKYLSQKEAVRLNINGMESKYERKHCGDGI